MIKEMRINMIIQYELSDFSLNKFLLFK